MRIKISGRAVELATRSDGLEMLDLVLKSVGEVCNFFAHGGGRGALSVRPTQHWHVCQLTSQRRKLFLKTPHLWQNHLLKRMMEHQTVGQVIDILGCAREVQIFLMGC